MKSLKHFPSYLPFSIFLTGCLLSGCKRDIPPLPTDELRNVTFKLSGFEAETEPMDGLRVAERLALGKGAEGIQALLNIKPSLEPQYLYYWSFNAEDLEPDIAVDEIGAGITFHVEADFKGGFSNDTVDAGSALSLVGAQELEISLPLRTIESLATFDFDISSSNTGPKDFLLSYSIDNGDTYEELSAENQFEKMGAQTRNSYEFDLEDLPQFIESNQLKLKFDFLAGDRPLRPVENEGEDPLPWEYSENSGVVRLDNIRLSGVYNAESSTPTTPSTLHYYIFSSEDGSVVQQQELAMDALGDGGALDVKLADGSYDVLFVAYRSDKGVLLRELLTNANEFYFGQHFDDHQAVTYATLLTGVVIDEAHVEEAATLSRCYSLVEFDFTDSEADLQRVKKVEIIQLHDGFLYTPFGMPAAAEPLEADRIEFSSFDKDDKIAFHQFFGLLDVGVDISYELIAYGEGDVILNTVTITEELRNNQILRLTGRLLGDAGAINGFSIMLDTEWGGTLEGEF